MLCLCGIFRFNDLESCEYIMKFKHTMWFFAVSLGACTFIRILQLLFTLDPATGFVKSEYRAVGIAMMAIIVIAALTSVVIGISVRRCPVKMPKVKPLLGIGSILLGVSILVEVLWPVGLRESNVYIVVALETMGFFAGALFIAYGVKAFVKYKLPAPLFMIPVAYWAVKLIHMFMSMATISLITDNILICAAYGSSLVFMLEFAKLANKINVETTSRGLIASGMCASIFSVVASLPRFVVVLIGHSEVLHESVFSTLTMLVTGIFMILFIAYYFRNKNLSRHHRKHSGKSKRFMPVDENTQYQFYLGRTRVDKNK